MSTQIQSTGFSGNARFRHEGGNVVRTDRYDIHVSRDEVKVFDRKTGEWIRAWGDPHVETGDGDKAKFHSGNLTLDLADGTKLTMRPTEMDANGIAFIDSVVITNGKNGMVISGVHTASGPQFGAIGSNGRKLDDQVADGTVLRAREELENLMFLNTDGLWSPLTSAPGGGEFDLDGLGGYAQSSSGGSWDAVRHLDAQLDRLRAVANNSEADATDRQAAIMEMGEIQQMRQQLIQMMSEERRAENEAVKTLIQNLRV